MARISIAQRARRMLTLLQQLEPGSDVSLDELARKMGATPAEVAADATALSMCGVAPYGPGELVDTYVEDGRVYTVGESPALDRPLRLSANEARAMASALQTAGFDSHTPLIDKLTASAASGFSANDLEQTLRTGHNAYGNVYATLASAVQECDVVRITHRSGGASGETIREIEPLALLNDRGAWYVSAYCRSAIGARTFRLDRIRSAETTGEHFAPRADAAAGPTEAAFSSDGLPVSQVRFSDAGLYSERDWPGSHVVTHDNVTVEVEVPYAGTEWIARRVAARLGAVEVVGPAGVRQAVVRVAEEIAADHSS